MASIFTKIVNKEISAYIVAETEEFMAFLDVSPVVYGHVLVIPKQEIDYIFDLDNETYTKLMLFSQIVAKALKKVVDCKKIGMSVVGLEVPHAHVHLIPINRLDDMNFSNPRVKLSEEEFVALAEKIRHAFTI